MSEQLEIFAHNLRVCLAKRGMNQSQLAEMMDLPAGTISRWATGKNFPKDSGTMKNLAEILKTSTDYLLGIENDIDLSASANKPVPFYDVDVTGGHDSLIEIIQEIEPQYFINIPKFQEGDLAIRIRGHSMKGYINHGEIVICKMIKGWDNFMIYGRPYLIITRTDNFRTIKFIKENKEDNSLLWLVPYNIEQFDEQLIPKDEILFMYEVLGTIDDQL